MIDILNSLVVLLNFIIIPGITYGSQLALGALGVTFVYAVLRFANFAHGELMSFGAMITILFTWFFQSSNIGLGILPTALLALPFGIITTIILSLISDKFVFKYYRQQKSVPVVLAMVSIGVMFVVNAIIRIIIGTDTIKFSDGQKFIMKAKQFKAITGLNEGLALKSSSVITILITIILLSFTFWFLQKTKTGKSMRAFSDNEDLALLSGINPNKVVFVTWLIVGTLACVAGTLYGLDKSYKPIIYLNLVLPVFASAIVGGIGSPFGAVVGGYVIAFSEIMVTYAYKKFFKYLLPDSLEPTSLVQILSTDYKFAVSFTILVIVLLIRPSGIFKGRVL
jgi:branched-chain amino acid transport system permease protein